ncbi:MAG: hypothetical protein LBT39_04905 [Treponema sp.]|nr:hypothetical protein [Treponema sp.]
MNKIAIVLLAALALLASCRALDGVANTSVKSFEAMLGALPEAPKQTDSGVDFSQWTLAAPDKTATFTWNDDIYAANGLTARLEFSAEPFVKAGLAGGKFDLPGGTLANGAISIAANLPATGKIDSNTTPGTALGAYKIVTQAARNRIGYHAALDHFGVDLGGGNMFEWAKDLSTNEKDIVFVLNPEPFIAAGVDPNRVEGWVYAKVPTMDERGRKIEVDKLLKPFNLR